MNIIPIYITCAVNVFCKTSPDTGQNEQNPLVVDNHHFPILH